MLSPWIIRTLTLPPLLASLIPRNFRRYHTPTIYLPQNSHHTYLLWHFHSHSEIYFHATFHRSVYYDTLHHCHIAMHDHVVDIVLVEKPQILCQLHDHAKQYDNDEACHNKWNGGKLHGNISRNGYGNAIIGRYGGCFEEGKWWVYGTGESCAVLERLAMMEG